MSSQNIDDLFQSAVDDGGLSPDAAGVIDIQDLGATIQAGLGVSVDDVEASEVTIITMLTDDSTSVRMIAGGCEAMREGGNAVIDALGESKSKDGILMAQHYLCQKAPLYPYRKLADAVRLDARNYNPQGGSTPLYKRALDVLALVALKAQEFANAGVTCRTVTCIATDGGDNDSQGVTPDDVKKVVKSMLAQETHIVTFMGIDDGMTDFKAVGNAMGIQDEWILTPGRSKSDIRKAFLVVSQSAVRASQAGGADFSKIALGGFQTT